MHTHAHTHTSLHDTTRLRACPKYLAWHYTLREEPPLTETLPLLQSRPFGVALLIAGWDDNGPIL